ncbi:hypothetical protein Q1695_011159 [Nippostrongylus brasiliensis]|nr:hypothetical protein Q1695_011159 [Nippostrongylus brasiliensis]
MTIGWRIVNCGRERQRWDRIIRAPHGLELDPVSPPKEGQESGPHRRRGRVAQFAPWWWMSAFSPRRNSVATHWSTRVFTQGLMAYPGFSTRLEAAKGHGTGSQLKRTDRHGYAQEVKTRGNSWKFLRSQVKGGA